MFETPHKSAHQSPTSQPLGGGPDLPTDFWESSPWKIADFQDFEEIGKGKDTIIYKSFCTKLMQSVALKVYSLHRLSSSKHRAVRREISMMAFFMQKQVPSVVNYVGAFKDENHMYIIMECCGGGDLLEALLARKRPLKEHKVAERVALPLLTSLAAIHSLGIIHRDIKLENIFIDSRGDVKFGDFGLTMSIHQEKAISPVGTVEYMAPEVICIPTVDQVANGSVDPTTIVPHTEKADIWSLGVTIYELVTGHLPVPGKHKDEIKGNVLKGKLLPPPKQLSQETKDLLASMFIFSEKQRPSAVHLLQHPFFLRYCPGATDKARQLLIKFTGKADLFSDSGMTPTARRYSLVATSSISRVSLLPSSNEKDGEEMPALMPANTPSSTLLQPQTSAALATCGTTTSAPTEEGAFPPSPVKISKERKLSAINKHNGGLGSPKKSKPSKRKAASSKIKLAVKNIFSWSKQY